MKLQFDNEGNLVGLDNDQFTFWYHTTDGKTTYQIQYRVDRKDHSKAEVHSIHKYTPGLVDKDIHVGKGLVEAASDRRKIGMYFPEKVDWVATFKQYYLDKVDGQALTGELITQQPLVAAPPFGLSR